MSGSAPDSASHTGAAYFERITAREVNRRMRSTFQNLVLGMAPPGATLLDFGAGPGIDARFFAERGFVVEAYDVDPQMCEFFASHCRELIDSGRVTLDCTGYREFLGRKTLITGRSADLVISDFAPLNQVDDLPELFAKFHAITGTHGKLLLSVLTPYFVDDLKTRRWWRNAPRLWRDGHFFVPGGGAPPHTRRRLADFRALSSPYFTLTRVFCALPANSKRGANGIDLIHGGRYAWLHLARSRFMILLFEKRD
jgi:cyclopropane fatty-acyl-phospholipid synthase-like methyltransferase